MADIKTFPQQRYSGGAMAFHWTMAILIAAVGIMGLLFDDMPKAWKGPLVNLHVVLGVTIIALLAGRIWWRFTHRPPPLPAGTTPLNRQLSSLGHLALYGLMALVPLAGLSYQLARGRGIDFYLFQVPPLMDRLPDIARPLRGVHSLSADALMLLALGHMALALWHQYVMRDGLMARMMPAGAPATMAAKKPVSLK